MGELRGAGFVRMVRLGRVSNKEGTQTCSTRLVSSTLRPKAKLLIVAAFGNY